MISPTDLRNGKTYYRVSTKISTRKLKMLKNTLKELMEKENLLIECEQKTRGRTVVGLVLRFTPDPQGSLPL